MAAVAAIEVACWDIVGKAAGTPGPRAARRPHPRPRPRLRQRLVPGRAHARGVRGAGARRSSSAATRRSSSIRSVPPTGSRSRGDEDARRSTSWPPSATRSGPDVDLMIEAPQPLQRLDRAAASPIDWPSTGRPGSRSRSITSTSARWSRSRDARRCRSPRARASPRWASSPTSWRHDAVHILQPEPLFLGGLWRTRQLAAMADAHYARRRAAQRAGAGLRRDLARSWAPASRTSTSRSRSTSSTPGWTREIVDRPIVPWTATSRCRPSRDSASTSTGSAWRRIPTSGSTGCGCSRLAGSDAGVAARPRRRPRPTSRRRDRRRHARGMPDRPRGARARALAEAVTCSAHVAGAEANVAVGLARLGDAARSSDGSAPMAWGRPSCGGCGARAWTSAICASTRSGAPA